MTQTIWQVKVYEDDFVSYTLYHFANEADVIESIKLTWSRASFAVNFECKDYQTILVTDMADRSRICVTAEAIAFDLLTQPTHF